MDYDKSEFSFRPYRQGDENAINAGFNEIFNLQRSMDEWHWKYRVEKNGSWILVGVDSSGEIVTHYGAIKQRLHVDGDVYQIGQALDVFRLRRPSTKGKRLIVPTIFAFYDAFCSADNLAFQIGFPGARTKTIGEDYTGWSDTVHMHLWRRKVPRLVWSFASNVRQQPPTELNSHGFDTLWHRAKNRYPCAQVRDYKWIQRRYITHPHATYHYLTAYEGKKLTGWAILRLIDGILHWVDVLWDGEKSETFVALNRAVFRFARQHKAKELHLWLPADEQAIAILQKLGWQREPHPLALYLFAQSWHPKLQSRDILKRMYYTMGDTDLY